MLGQIRIHSYTSSEENDNMEFVIRDQNSRCRFLTFKITKKELIDLIQSKSVEIDYTLKDAHLCGKYLIIEKRVKSIPSENPLQATKEYLEQYIKDNFQEDGWFLDAYLGSQDSVSWDHKNKCNIVRYSVYKYVEEKENG